MESTFFFRDRDRPVPRRSKSSNILNRPLPSFSVICSVLRTLKDGFAECGNICRCEVECKYLNLYFKWEKNRSKKPLAKYKPALLWKNSQPPLSIYQFIHQLIKRQVCIFNYLVVFMSPDLRGKSQSQVKSKSWFWLFLFKKQKSSQVLKSLTFFKVNDLTFTFFLSKKPSHWLNFSMTWLDFFAYKSVKTKSKLIKFDSNIYHLFRHPQKPG